MVNEPEQTPNDEPATFVPSPEHPQASAPEEAPVATDAPVREDEEGYTVGKWGELDNFECKSCPFSTLDLYVMEEHLQRHTPQIETSDPQQRVRRRYMRRD